ncbi:cytochrome b [Pelagibius sp. Alg239-R121]|uniref:cytochrome b n=1 Tax=Pelagibius sp. Alg239-R121 TaxID=2993448 RepID=UPI0024A71C8E|nr:cytochrome b/b6 domain-containing protein [Pelagibius sp. Alg239-R121]
MKDNLEKTWVTMLCLHCGLAAVIVVVTSFGLYLEPLDNGLNADHLLDLHKMAGFVVVALAAPCFVWRSLAGAPPRTRHSAGRRYKAVCVAHGLLLSSILLLPVSGVLAIVWSGRDVSWLGLHLISAGPKSETLRALCLTLHELSAFLMAAVLLGHLILALRGLVIERDGAVYRLFSRRLIVKRAE